MRASSGISATPNEAVILRSTRGNGDRGDDAAEAFGVGKRAGAVGVGEEREELFSAVASTEVLGSAQGGGECLADSGEHVVAGLVAVVVVDVLKVVKVKRERRQWLARALCVSDEALDDVLHRPGVGQAGESVGRGLLLGDREGAQVRQYGGGLGDRQADLLGLACRRARRGARSVPIR